MKPCANRAVPLRLAVGVVVAAMLAVPLGLSSFARDRSSPAGGFVLLSMEQATMYRGTQPGIWGSCGGTATYPQCSGTTALCSSYSFENCPSFDRSYPRTPITYCTGWAPGSSNDCQWNGLKRCYTESNCLQNPELGTCCHPLWPLGSVNVVQLNDDTCVSLNPRPPGPPPSGDVP